MTLNRDEEAPIDATADNVAANRGRSSLGLVSKIRKSASGPELLHDTISIDNKPGLALSLENGPRKEKSKWLICDSWFRDRSGLTKHYKIVHEKSFDSCHNVQNAFVMISTSASSEDQHGALTVRRSMAGITLPVFSLVRLHPRREDNVWSTRAFSLLAKDLQRIQRRFISARNIDLRRDLTVLNAFAMETTVSILGLDMREKHEQSVHTKTEEQTEAEKPDPTPNHNVRFNVETSENPSSLS
ncbi:MAG: hypothetical protein LQ351_006974 [Letrouitia transgressa]|nr:MAG: hypothetical protein LQ351_006974 [Letrouitia transgressa]